MFIDICHDSGSICVKKEDVKYMEMLGSVITFHVHSVPFALKIHFSETQDAVETYYFYKKKLGA